jgi:hypothetical protein
VRRTNVVDLAHRIRMIDQLHQRANDILHEAETPRLGAVAVHGDRLVRQCLPDERGNHHAVVARLSWSDRIEEPDDRDREVSLAVKGEREEFIHRLRAGVAPAAFRG